MLILLSPAKKQAKTVDYNDIKTTRPAFVSEAEVVIDHMSALSKKQLAALMKISDTIAASTYQSVKDFDKNPEYPALFLYQGAVYQNMQPTDFSQSDLAYAQKNLVILTGLYGYLRPLDLIKHYRLEMGTALKVDGHSNLYGYWKEKVSAAIDSQLKKQKQEYVINLASNEYFKVIDKNKLYGKVITIDFKDLKNNTYKTIGVNAKRARGLMARYIIKNQIDNPKGLQKFNGLEYQFSQKMSSDSTFVFVRNA